MASSTAPAGRLHEPGEPAASASDDGSPAQSGSSGLRDLGDPILDGLTDEQRAVVTAPTGPLLVLAGAGSGKTRVLTHRVAYLLRQGTAPERVLLMTFTNQAARQMVARLHQLLPQLRRGPLWAGTFHHIALRVLRSDGWRLGLRERFTVLDRHDAADVMASCLAELVPPGRGWPRASLLQSLLSLSVNTEQPLEVTLERFAPEWRPIAPELQAACDRYVARKLRMSLCDFDDLILYWRLLLCDHAAFRREQHARFQHLFVDEYQDISQLQSALCDDLAAASRSLTAVGDDAQSIYRFRGAEIQSLLSFRTRWPDASILQLRTNFRSLPAIVALSNQSIARNAAEQSVPRLPMRSVFAGQPDMVPALLALPDARVQAAFVAQRITEAMAAGRPASDIAVLYRNHRHARELQVELLRAQIPYVIRSGQRFSEQAHIKDALSFLRLCHNPGDEVAWSRVLRQVPGVGDTTRARLLHEISAQILSGQDPVLDGRVLRVVRAGSRLAVARLAALLTELRERTVAATDPAAALRLPAQLLELVLVRHYRDYAERSFADAPQRLRDLANLQTSLLLGAEPVQAALPLGPAPAAQSLGELLSALTSGEEAPAEPAPTGQVTLSTVHQAKGLEWGAVFVLWLADGHFPSVAALSEPEDAESLTAAEAEERRLFYVATTRAREELYLCYPCATQTQGALRVSRFLHELDGADAPFERWAVRVE